TTNELKDIFLSLAKSFLGTSPSTVIRDDLTAMLAGFDFVSASDGGIFAGNSLSWNLGDLQCGETRQVTFTMQPRLCGTNPGDYPNSAVVTNGIGSSNNSNQTQVKLLLPNLTISVTDNASLAKVGQQLDFVVHVANTGDGNSGVFTAEYLAPEGLEILPNSISAGGVLTAGGKVAWQLQLAPGEEQDLTLSTIVKDSVADGYSDMVSIARLSTGCGSIESSDRTQAFKEVTPDPDYTLRVDCVNYREGKIEAFFGYQNNLSDLQPLDESELSPANADGHAPKVLRSGNYEQAFSASASSEVITWSTSVAGESQAVTADRNSPACPATPATPQMPSYPPTDIVIGGPKVDVPASQSPNFPPAVLISGSTKLALCNTR
ncbi:hypothetical protein KC640_03540, partial [Candidatus Dojkabacteria bacterium]|nr:hypothetical protein [Candidatus Dojkabacteria bacterium]